LSPIWFLSQNFPTWELAIIYSFARNMRERGIALSIYAEEELDRSFISTECWSSLTEREKLWVALSQGNVWHFWGGTPWWGSFLSLRSRLFYGLCEKTVPSRGTHLTFFSSDEDEMSTYIPPIFESKIAWTMSERNSCEGTPSLYMAGSPHKKNRWYKNVLSAWEAPLFKIPFPEANMWPGRIFPNSSLVSSYMGQRGGALLLLSSSPSLALLAAHATILGVPIISTPSKRLDELLSREGYITITSQENERELLHTLQSAFDSMGKEHALKGRNYLLSSWAIDRGLQALMSLYSQEDGV
jgi:hypothetical protein